MTDDTQPRNPVLSHGPMLRIARAESGAVVDIASLAAAKKRGAERPRCSCLACGGRLTAKLGTRKRHHFAHRPELGGARCWASAPEGELHLNAKWHLQQALRKACDDGASLCAQVTCPVCGSGATQKDVLRLHPKLLVVVEDWGDPRNAFKPDVLIVNAQHEPVLFLEVRVTHGCSDAKVRRVMESKVPMLEVKGEDANSWEGADKALVCIDHLNLGKIEPCDACALPRMHPTPVAAKGLRPTTAGRTQPPRYDRQWKRVVAWCNVYVFRGPRRAAATQLEVTLAAEGATTSMILRDRASGASIKSWSGTPDELRRIYGGELRREALLYAQGLMGKIGPDAELETFGGFRTSNCRDIPPEHFRARKQTGEWFTAYPWPSLEKMFGRERLERLVREGDWETVITEEGIRAVAAGPVHALLVRTRVSPRFGRLSVHR